VSLEAFEIEFNAVRQINSNSVSFAVIGRIFPLRNLSAAVLHLKDLFPIFDDALGKEKPRGKLGVIARRSHCYGNGVVNSPAVDNIANANFEGLFDSKHVFIENVAHNVRRNAADSGG
jgi:hypothetical protein